MTKHFSPQKGRKDSPNFRKSNAIRKESDAYVNKRSGSLDGSAYAKETSRRIHAIGMERSVLLRMKDIAIDYLGGSGFLVGLGDTGMLFDASEHGSDQRMLPDRAVLSAFKRLYVFISHHHEDHFSPAVYDLCGSDAVYIVGFDVPEPYRGVRMSPGEERGFGPVSVHAYGSTDDGVSFLVTYAGIVLFHAGDLNLWHWRDESSITEIEAAEKAFYACVAPIPQQKIDVAFFPVDPRQGSMYDAGAGYFVMTVKPRFMVPMHFQGRADVAMRFSVTGETPYTKIVPLQEPGDHIDLHIPDTEESAPDRRLRALLSEEDREDGMEGVEIEETDPETEKTEEPPISAPDAEKERRPAESSGEENTV